MYNNYIRVQAFYTIADRIRFHCHLRGRTIKHSGIVFRRSALQLLKLNNFDNILRQEPNILIDSYCFVRTTSRRPDLTILFLTILYI